VQVRCPLPSPQLQSQGAARLPEGLEWRYELKLDGFRAIGRKAERTAQLWSRNQKNFARRFPTVVKALGGLPDDTVIDGEVVETSEISSGVWTVAMAGRVGRKQPAGSQLRSVTASWLARLRKRRTHLSRQRAAC
jgi:hypothetical protein